MKKRILSLLLAGIMTMGLLVGCDSAEPKDQVTSTANEEQTSQVTSKKDEVVEIDFYVAAGVINDLDRVLAKANETIEKEIGAHLNLISLTDYTTMQLMIDTGDQWDMCFTSNWLGDYYGNAHKGAYADLTELLPKLAPETYSRIPEGIWDDMKVGGKIYGFTNYQKYGVAKNVGLRFRTDIAEEVGFDWKALKGMDILDAMNKVGKEYLTPAMAAHPDMIGWEAQDGSCFYTRPQAAQFFNCEYVGDSAVGSIGWINFDNPTKAFNQFDTKEFMEYCKIMRDWYKKGYIPADAATVTETSTNRSEGKYLFEMALDIPDTIDFPRVMAMSLASVEVAPAGIVSMCEEALLPAGAGSVAAVAVNADSKNIDKSVELMELLNTNDDLFKLLSSGEEGVDYAFDKDGKFVSEVEGKYAFMNWSEWQLAQSFDPDCTRLVYTKDEKGESDKALFKRCTEIDKTAAVSPLSGFVFNPESVKTEMANVTSVVSEMIPSIVTGSVDPEKKIPEFLNRLEQAGAAKIITEKQAQLDKWSASK